MIAILRNYVMEVAIKTNHLAFKNQEQSARLQPRFFDHTAVRRTSTCVLPEFEKGLFISNDYNQDSAELDDNIKHGHEGFILVLVLYKFFNQDMTSTLKWAIALYSFNNPKRLTLKLIKIHKTSFSSSIIAYFRML